MRYEVFHCTTPDESGRIFGRLTPARFPDHFTHVATVAAASLEDAWTLTQHLDFPWWENEGVDVHGPLSARSTSMGDVIIDEHGSAMYAVAFGFRKVPADGLVAPWEEALG